MKKTITEMQVTLTLREKIAIKQCVRMAEAHIAEWQFHDKVEKESVKTAKRFLRGLKVLGTKAKEEEK